MAFMAWPEIEGFHNIRKFIRVDPGEWWMKRELLSGTSTVTYKCKVKLHGTNAAIQVHWDGTVVAQSRTNIITPENDNAGFARWVMSPNRLSKIWDNAKGHIIYGEWCGPGIQKGVAISEIPHKVFVVFAARLLDGSDSLIVEPEELEKLVSGIPDVYVLPWYSRPCHHGCDTNINMKLEIDWKKTNDELTTIIAPVNEWVASIEERDPWVKDTFGVEGTGEGLVFYPVSEAHLGFENFQNLCFKAKGEKHKNIATAKPVQVSAESAASVDAFCNLVLTPARLEQGARAIMGEHKHEERLSCLWCTTGKVEFDLKMTGKFIAWITGDVQKECQDELSASNLEWKQVQKALGDKARAWYIAESKIR